MKCFRLSAKKGAKLNQSFDNYFALSYIESVLIFKSEICVAYAAKTNS